MARVNPDSRVPEHADDVPEVSRRGILLGVGTAAALGAWALPSLVSANAAPSATVSPVPDYTGNTIVLTSHGAEGNQGPEQLNFHVDHHYQRGNSAHPNMRNYPNVPTTISTHWLVEIIDSSHAVVLSIGGTVTAGNFAFQQKLPASAPLLTNGGMYTVRFSITADPVTAADGKVYQANPVSVTYGPIAS